jgi:ankyrin repeat protein
LSRELRLRQSGEEIIVRFARITQDSAHGTVQQMDLFEKFKSGDILYAQAVLADRTVSPTACDQNDCSLLHWVAVNNHLQLAELLLHHGADPNVRGGLLKETPLHW